LNAGAVVGVVEEDKTGGAAGVDFDVDLDGVGVASDCSREDGGVGDGFAAGLKLERAVTSLEAGGIELAPEAPLETQLGGGEVVRRIAERLLNRAGDGHGDGGVGVDAGRYPEPAVVGPLDGQQEELAAEGAVAVLVGVDGHVPLAGGGIDQPAVADGEPSIVAGAGVGDGVVG